MCYAKNGHGVSKKKKKRLELLYINWIVLKKTKTSFSHHPIFFLMLAQSLPTQIPTFEEEVTPGRVLEMKEDGTGLSVLDPWLAPFDGALRHR
jgi:hypothetical protein